MLIPVQVLRRAMYLLLDVAGPHELQLLHSALGQVPGARATLRALHRDYTADHRFKGAV